MLRFVLAVLMLGAGALPLHAQFDPLSRQAPSTPNPLSTPTLTPGEQTLFQLEADFAADVARRGGQAFASWFADDGIELPNGQAPTRGRDRIVATAHWDPKTYHLTWKPDAAEMSPAGDSGFTWGHYEALSRDAQGEAVERSGRYITFWKKVNGAWKVALDASADEPSAADCCALPKP